MEQRTTLAYLIVVSALAAMGCSAVVKGTLDMKDDAGGSCTNDEQCDDDEPCNGSESCTGGTCQPGTPQPDDATCNVGDNEGVCRGEVCVYCGDMVVQPEFDEECDDGANDDDDDGCTSDCFYSCENDGECDDGFACNGREICTLPDAVNLIRLCQTVPPLPPPMSMCMVDGEIGDGRCVFPASGELLCCGMAPVECCEYDPADDVFICGLMPPPPP